MTITFVHQISFKIIVSGVLAILDEKKEKICSECIHSFYLFNSFTSIHTQALVLIYVLEFSLQHFLTRKILEDYNSHKKPKKIYFEKKFHFLRLQLITDFTEVWTHIVQCGLVDIS